MAFGDGDLSVFLADFGEPATLKQADGQTVRTLTVIFDAPSQEPRVFDAAQVRPGPTAVALSTEIGDAREGYLLNLHGHDFRVAQKPRALEDGKFSAVELRE
jgi:hypothetical protein